MCTFDPRLARETMAPNLSNEYRLTYISKELETIQDLLEGAEDCKWIYQALLKYTMLEYSIKGESSGAAKSNLVEWLNELRKLDPLRKGRWDDLSRTLDM